jgi:hypothetical protein
MSEKKHNRGKEKISIENLTDKEIKDKYELYLNKRRQAQKNAYDKLKSDPERKQIQDEKRREYQNNYYKKNKEKFKERNAKNRERYKQMKEEKQEEKEEELKKMDDLTI